MITEDLNLQDLTLTQRQGVCPNCKADSHISYSTLKDQYDPDAVYFDVKCHNCGTTWDEHYSLVFYEQDNIYTPQKQLNT